MNKKALITGALMLALSAVSQAAVKYVGNTADADVTTVINLASDPSGTYGGTYYPADPVTGSRPVWQWTADDTFVLEEIIFITGGDLLIDAGSVVRGQPRNNSTTYNPGALVISRGAKILAQGNSANPIIFTTASSTGATSGGRVSGANPAFWDNAPLTAPKAPTSAGSWGGVLICGNAPTNVDRNAAGTQDFFDITGAGAVNTDDRSSIEGIPAGSANTGGFDRFGGFAESDNSGIMSYCSIRHGGANLSSNNEINGLTMGGVGRGTTINYIEIWGNTDDGVEIFGGTVNLDHIVIVAPQDDGLDLDSGYTGTVQFLAVIASGATDKLGEWDGSYQDEGTVNGFSTPSPVTVSRTPVAQFTIANATMIGNTVAATTDKLNSGLNIRDQAAPRLVNSILVNLRSGPASGLVEVDDRAVDAYATTNMFAKEIAYFKGVTFFDSRASGAFTTVGEWVANGTNDAAIEAKLSEPKFSNVFSDNPGFVNLPSGGSFSFTSSIDLRPVTIANGPTADDDFVGANSAFQAVSYRGAFDPLAASHWTADWSAADVSHLLVK